MRIGFDESGTFAFGDGEFDSGSIGAVACPDSALAYLESEFARIGRENDVDEIHASKLPPEVLYEVCAVIGASDAVWAAVYTDSRLLPSEQQEDFRRRQVEKADEGIAASVTLADDPERMRDARRTRDRILYATRVTPQEYLEFLVLFPRALGDILAGSLRTYRDRRWAPDLAELRFESDRKLTRKLSMGEKTLADALPRFLANNGQFVLDIPAEWSWDHPFLHRHRDPATGTITVPRILGDGIDFVDSKASTIVQAADVVAHVTRRAAVGHGDHEAVHAYRLLRRRGYATTLTPIRIFSDRLGPAADPHWFSHLALRGPGARVGTGALRARREADHQAGSASATAPAMASRWLRETVTRTPSSRARSATAPCSANEQFSPPRSTSTSSGSNPSRPSALTTASLAAKRAARFSLGFGWLSA